MKRYILVEINAQIPNDQTDINRVLSLNDGTVTLYDVDTVDAQPLATPKARIGRFRETTM